MGLVVAHAERRLVSNLSTGTQFLGRESNSHYHLHLLCLMKVDPSFIGKNLVVPEELKPLLTAVQKMYLAASLAGPCETILQHALSSLFYDYDAFLLTLIATA